MMKRRLGAAVLTLLAGWLVALSPWSGAAQAQTQTLVSTTVNITAYSAPNPRGTAYFNANVSLNFVAGTTYTIKTAPDAPAYSIDTYIYLLDPSGSVVGSNDDNGQGWTNPYGSYLSFNATVSGPHTLVVSTYSSGVSYSAVPVTVTYTGAPQPGGGGVPVGGVPNVRLTPNSNMPNSSAYAAIRSQSPISPVIHNLRVLSRQDS